MAKEARETRSYPLRYRLRTAAEPVVQGEFRCTGQIQTAVDVMVSSKLSQGLVVAAGLARQLHDEGVLPDDANLLTVADIRDSIAAHPFEAARRRAEHDIHGDMTAEEAVYAKSSAKTGSARLDMGLFAGAGPMWITLTG